MAALLAGLAYPLAFAPFEIVSLAYVTLAILFWLWKDSSPLRASLHGFLFGAGQFAGGLYWIYVCLHGYAGATALVAFLFNTAAVLVLAGFLALTSFFAAIVGPDNPAAKLMLVYPGTWILSEWLRAWLELPGCPWLQIGYSQLEAIPAALGPVLGVYGIGFFVVFSVGAALYCLQAGPSARKIVLSGLGLCWTVMAFLQQVAWTSPLASPLKVVLLQGNIPQKLKWLPETKQQTLRWYIEMSRTYRDANLIVWPETAVPVSYHKVAGLLDELGREAARHGSDLLIGMPVYDFDQQRSFNAMVTVGAGQGRYLKKHLVPFGEYLPLQPVSGLIAQYTDFQLHGFSPGTIRQPPIKAAGFPLAPSICYESLFGQELLATMPDAAYLVNITNDGWFGHSIALDQNLQMARMRSLETGRYMVRASNTGLTAIISPHGDLVKLAPPFIATALVGEIQPMQGATPYILVGDYLILGFIVVSLLVVCIPQGRRRIIEHGLTVKQG